MIYKYLIKPFLFSLPPEKAHTLTLSLLKFLFYLPGVKYLFRSCFAPNLPGMSRWFFGLHFKNPVGLAAGFDKNARMVYEFSNLGFGFIEVGTVTPKPQPGNPKPRLFRLPKDQALINRMGFNNVGVEKVAKNIQKARKRGIGNVVIGGNIGKNKTTPNSEALKDYEACFDVLFPHVDYFVVNVSSPNTPDLRKLQEKGPLKKILSRLQEINHSHEIPKPLLLKIAPDLNQEQLDDIVEIITETHLDGIIATNTTIDRKNLHTPYESVKSIGNGGLSGKPLKNPSNYVIKYLHHKTGGKTPIIGVGGITHTKDTLDKMTAGASMIQVYTGYIYEGPSLVKKILQGLNKHQQND